MVFLSGQEGFIFWSIGYSCDEDLRKWEVRVKGPWREEDEITIIYLTMERGDKRHRSFKEKKRRWKRREEERPVHQINEQCACKKLKIFFHLIDRGGATQPTKKVRNLRTCCLSSWSHNGDIVIGLSYHVWVWLEIKINYILNCRAVWHFFLVIHGF